MSDDEIDRLFPAPTPEAFAALGPSEVTYETWADATWKVRAMARWTSVVKSGDARAAAAMLAYRFPDRWWPPPEDVTIAEIARWMGCSEPFARRVLHDSESSLGPFDVN